MKPTLTTYWSRNAQRRLHKIGLDGNSRTLILNDSELELLAELAQGATNDDQETS